MPPPPRPVTSALSPRETQDATGSVLNHDPIVNGCHSKPSTQRSPLSEMTASDINVRVNEKPDPLLAEMQMEQATACFPVATQIVRDTLSGLCSQDFDDDFVDELVENEKENHSPFSSFKSTESTRNNGTTVSPQAPRHGGSTTSDCLDADWGSPALDEASESDEFDDEGINDEVLLSLAATQQLKHEFLQSSKRRRCSQSNEQATRVASNLAQTRSPRQSRQISSKNAAPTLPRQTGDSFAMDGLDDSDLIEGLEDFENDTEGLDDEEFVRCIEGLEQTKNHRRCDAESEGIEIPAKKKRRVLPWDRNPIPDLMNTEGDHTGMDDELTPSPVSVLYDD